MGSDRDEESQLWARSVLGDGEAFGSLYDRHRDRVFRHAYRLIAQRQDAEDLMAAAFLELWRHRDRVRVVDGSVLPWLLVTTTNLSRNASRSARRYRTLLDSLRPADETSPGRRGDPQDVVATELATALGSLSPADRRLVTLVVLEGYPVASAAFALSISAAAAKTRLHRARHRMRQALTSPAATHPLATNPAWEAETR